MKDVPEVPDSGKGVLSRMADRGIPVISLLNVKELALRYGLPIDPVPLPAPGEGELFRHRSSPLGPLAALGCLAAAFAGVIVVLRRRARAAAEEAPMPAAGDGGAGPSSGATSPRP